LNRRKDSAQGLASGKDQWSGKRESLRFTNLKDYLKLKLDQ